MLLFGVVNPPVHVFGPAGHAENFLAAIAGLHPDRAAFAGPMHQPMRHAAQGHQRAGLKRCRLRQPAETRGDPAAVKLREILGLRERAARRHGQDRFAVGRMNAQRIAPRAAVPPQPDREELRAVLDQKFRGFGRPPIEERASCHV